jgi:hypothetical protein
MLYRVNGAQVRDANTGELNRDLVGQPIRIVIRDTTTPFPIQDNAGDPIPDSDLIVMSTFEIPWFWIDALTPADLYLDWLHVASGARGPVNFEAVLREMARAAQEAADAAVKSVNGVGPDEDGDVQVEAGGGVDDPGMAVLIDTPTSATAQALTELYGPKNVFLDLNEPRPPDTPEGALIFRNAGGGGGPVVPVVYLTDNFERTVPAGSIGAPSGGGTYSALDIPTDWSVAGGSGVWKAPAAGARGGFFRSADYSQANVEIVGSISQASGNVGNRTFAIQPRRIAAQSNQYAANIVLRGPAATRPFQVDVGLQKGVTEGDLQSIVGGVLTTGAFGQRVLFKVRITQVDAATTRVQARVWLEGTDEPATWQRDATDTTAVLQGPGSFAILVRQNTPETIGSEARIHEYTVRSIV